MKLHSIYLNVTRVTVHLKLWQSEHALLLFQVERGILIHQHASRDVLFKLIGNNRTRIKSDLKHNFFFSVYVSFAILLSVSFLNICREKTRNHKASLLIYLINCFLRPKKATVYLRGDRTSQEIERSLRIIMIYFPGRAFLYAFIDHAS